jgi:hypothetical protein
VGEGSDARGGGGGDAVVREEWHVQASTRRARLVGGVGRPDKCQGVFFVWMGVAQLFLGVGTGGRV